MEGGGAGDVMCDVNRLFIGHTGDAGTYRWRLLASTTRALTRVLTAGGCWLRRHAL